MTGTMTWAAMDVHARSTYAASLDVVTGELSRQRFDTARSSRWSAGWLGCRGRCAAATRRARPGSGLPGGGRGGDRLSGDRAVEDAASVGGSQQVRPPRHRSVVASVDGRRADGGRGPVGDVRGGAGSGAGARAGQGRSDALPAPALEAAVAPRPRVGPQRVDEGAPRVAGSADLRARSTPSWRSSTTSPRATG